VLIRSEWEGADLSLVGKRGLMVQGVIVAAGTAGVETGQLLIVKRCLCYIAFFNYKCTRINIGILHNIVSFLYVHMS
jgi:hypothetical protein